MRIEYGVLSRTVLHTWNYMEDSSKLCILATLPSGVLTLINSEVECHVLGIKPKKIEQVKKNNG
jgi:hypothetical protein